MFKNIKSLFIIEEENPKVAPKEQAKPSATPTPKAPTPAAAPVNTGSGQVTQEFTDILFNAMQQANPEGFDYMEFKQSLQSLKKMAMDEPTRYQSAFAMAQTLGATVDKLAQSAQFYLDVLKNEEQKFAQAVQNQRSKLIGNRQQQIDQLGQTIQSKEEQIKRLTQEIEAHRQQMDQIKQEIADATVKVETTQQNFTASYNALSGQIAGDLENIQKYLK
ncbi:MAG: hypothetical protein ACK4TA_20485 [Saprospiraceae bacterium]